MSNEILNKIRPDFNFVLDEYKFSLVDWRKSESFGDYYIDLESNEFRIRFVSDRGQRIVRISSINDKNNWYDLYLVKAFIKQLDVMTVPDFAELAKFLRENFQLVADLFNFPKYPETKESLNNLEKKRAAKMFPNLRLKT